MDSRIHRSAAFAIKQDSGYSLVVPPPDPGTQGISHHSGTALLISPNWARFKGRAFVKSERLISVPFHFPGHTVVFISVYQFTDPHSLNKVSAAGLSSDLEDLLGTITRRFKDPHVFVMGDLNEVMDVGLDRTPRPDGTPRPERLPLMGPISVAFGLVDCFRTLYPSERSYTYRGPSSQSRIDYLWMDRSSLPSLVSCGHVLVPQLYTDHLLVWADILVDPLLPLSSAGAEGLPPEGLVVRKHITPDQWDLFRDEVEGMVSTGIAQGSPPTVEGQWDVLSTAIQHGGLAHIARCAKSFKPPRGKVHPARLFPKEPEAIMLRALLEEGGPIKGVDDPEDHWYRMGDQFHQLLLHQGWPTSYLVEGDQPGVVLQWWEWADQRIRSLNRSVARLRRKCLAQRIRAAIEARCSAMGSAMSRSLRSILDRHSEPISASLRVLVKTGPEGDSYLTQWPDVDAEVRDIYHQWTASRNPDVNSLLACPRWAEVYHPLDPNQSPMGTIGSGITSYELDQVLRTSPHGKSPAPRG